VDGPAGEGGGQGLDIGAVIPRGDEGGQGQNRGDEERDEEERYDDEEFAGHAWP
jgi:hypothetical protein